MKEHIIKKDETLWGISKKYYGDGSLYYLICRENNIENPDNIKAGEIIKIPYIELYTEKDLIDTIEKQKELINKITEIINNQKITGIEAKLMIQELLENE